MKLKLLSLEVLLWQEKSYLCFWEDSMEFTVQGKTISIYGEPRTNVPVIYLNTVHDEGKAVWDQCQRMGCPSFSLVAVSDLQWNHDMSPWQVPSVVKGDTPFTGGADAYLALLTEEILPAVEERLGGKPAYSALAGYSLAGLFAVYASCHTDAFAGIISASGSFWFPQFVDYVKGQERRRVSETMYFSLGDREAHTRNPCLSSVEERTKMLYEYYSRQGILTTLVMNPGNHFTHPNRRMAEGILWTITKKQ